MWAWRLATYHHGHLREALLQAAQSQIEAEGAHSLNLSKLARQLKVSQPAAYRHFANKQALIFSLVEQGFTLLIQHLEMATKSSAPDIAPESEPSKEEEIERSLFKPFFFLDNVVT